MKIQVVMLAMLLSAASWGAQNTDPGVKPDNTKVNQQDREANQPTADQQKNLNGELNGTREDIHGLVHPPAGQPDLSKRAGQ